jgi:hypothetical protein
MSRSWVLGIAFLLLLAAFPLISLGTTRENDVLWLAGLAMIVLGMLVPPVARYAVPEEDDDKGSAGGDVDDEEER